MDNEVVLDLTAATMKRRKSSGKRSHQKIRPLAERQRAIELYGTGKTKAEVARTLGIPESTLRGWIKEAKNLGLVTHASSGESSPCSPDSGKSAEQDVIDLSDSNEESRLVIDLHRPQNSEDGPKDYSVGKTARNNMGLNNNYEKSDQASYLPESHNGEDWRQLLQQAVQQKEDRRRSIATVPGKRKRKSPTPPAVNEWPQAVGSNWQQLQESLAQDPASLQRLQMHLLQQQMHLMQASPQFQQMMLLAQLQQVTPQPTTYQAPPAKKRRVSRVKHELQESKENLSTNSIEILEDQSAPIAQTAIKQKRKRRSKANLASEEIPPEIQCFYEPDYFMLQDYLLQQQQIIGERLAMAADSVFID